VEIYKEGVGSLFSSFVRLRWEMGPRSSFGMICGAVTSP
jgi:hypothetical protein